MEACGGVVVGCGAGVVVCGGVWRGVESADTAVQKVKAWGIIMMK